MPMLAFVEGRVAYDQAGSRDAMPHFRSRPSPSCAPYPDSRAVPELYYYAGDTPRPPRALSRRRGGVRRRAEAVIRQNARARGAGDDLPGDGSADLADKTIRDMLRSRRCLKPTPRARPLTPCSATAARPRPSAPTRNARSVRPRAAPRHGDSPARNETAESAKKVEKIDSLRARRTPRFLVFATIAVLLWRLWSSSLSSVAARRPGDARLDPESERYC